jgi:hypothetical protein
MGLLAALIWCGPSCHAAEPPAGPCQSGTSCGNSAFGIWTSDEFGLPAFRYDGCTSGTCDEPTDPTDAVHQLGNGATTALAHATGHVELFTERTYYRLANHYDAGSRKFSGGFGWVKDGNDPWSTLYPDCKACTYQRLFGMGYYKKTIEHGGLRIEHYVYLAPGGEEALLERIVFTNLSAAAKTLTYFDYWDVAWWLIRCETLITCWTTGYDPAQVRTSFDVARGVLKATSTAAPGDLETPSLSNDPSPKTAFVAFLGDVPDRFDSVQDIFFGAGPRALPDRVRLGELADSLDATGTLPNQNATLVTQKGWVLPAGEKRELNVIFGIADRGAEDAIIDRYRNGPGNRLPDLIGRWTAVIPRIELPEQAWIAREMAWSAYYLISGMQREDFFNTRVINQGSIYQYVWGANAGPRAALRHVIPLIYLDPAAAREVITYYLRAMKQTGELAYATAGYGGWQNFVVLQPSDHGLWLLWAAAEYVNATRDFDFVKTVHDFYCDKEGRGRCGSATAYEILKRAYDYQVRVVGTVGRDVQGHGLVRLKNSDWDDTLILNSPDPIQTAENGESTLNTVLAIVAYAKFADLAERRGDRAFAQTVRDAITGLSQALKDQWRGAYFNRGYIRDTQGQPIELGMNNMWLPANAFALLADGLLTPEQSTQLVAQMESQLLDSKLGLVSQGPPITPKFTAGFWYSLAGPALEGLAMRNDIPGARDLAWAAFRRQTLAAHAEGYPNLWYGVWSGPDAYSTPLDSSDPGGAGCWSTAICMLNFPVTNMFSHSEPLLGSVRMAGLSANVRGFTIDPVFPFASFSWQSRVLSIARTATGLQGTITPQGDDVLELRVRLPSGTATAVTVNDVPVAFSVENGFIRFQFAVTGGTSSRWTVQNTR